MWDDPRFAALVERFRERAAMEAAGIRAALADGDCERVRELAHSLAGAAGTFGFAEISDLARPLDEAAGAGQGIPDLEALAAPVLAAVDALLQAR
jgi:HPt (histidine-containing phosphotransfer) domain-containing protein